MAIRTRSAVNTQSKVLRIHTYWGENINASFEYWDRSENISDTNHNVARIKPVSHFKMTCPWGPLPSSGTYASDPSHTDTFSGDREWVIGSPSTMLAFAPGPPSSEHVAQLADAALDAMSDQVPQEVDLTNFLLDLREMGSLIPALQDNMAKTVSGGYLQYAFGWAPFISDLKKLGNLSKSVHDRLDWLRNTRGRSVRLGFESSWDNNEPETFDFSNFHSYQLRLGRVKNVFRAGGYLFHTLERLSGIEGELRAFSSALGLTNPSAVVWERIPFSFVADWFARTKSITDSLKLQPFPGEWNVREMSHSFKQFVEYDIYCTGSGYSNFVGKHVGTIFFERYTRGQNLPVSSSFLTTTELTSGQLVLATALLVSAAK